MISVSATAFTFLLVVLGWLMYAMGLAGCWMAAFLAMGAMLATGLAGYSDPGVLAVEIVASVAVIGYGWKSALRHQAWQARIQGDRDQGRQKQQDIERINEQLRARIVSGADDVERGLKQYELVKRLAEATSWEEMLPSLDKGLKYFFRAESWSLYLTNEENRLTLMQRRGAVPDPKPEDSEKHEAFLSTFVPSTGMAEGQKAWALALPLWRLHEHIGILYLRLAEFDPERQAALLAEANAFSVQLIFAMAKAKLFRELQERSRTDGLTGLTRRGPFEERLREEVARAKSFRTTFSILMIDIDHFKRMNDTYGHQVGDEVLRTVAQRLKEGLYETDVVARYGGEEFVCLLPRSQAAGLRQKAEQIRKRVEGQAFVIGLENVTVTISIGIAHFPSDGDSGAAVLAAADRALYAAKGAGRNQVMEASQVPR